MAAASSLWLDGLGLETHFHDAGGVRTRCLETGEGPPVVVLHGIEASGENHIRNLGALGKRRRVIAPDLLGHALTEKPDADYDVADYARHVLALLDSLEVERADIVGQSLGAWIACWLALEAPDRVGAIVLNTMAGLPVPDDSGWDAFAGLVERSAQAVESLDRELIRRRLEWVVADPAVVTDELVEVRARLWEQPGWASIAPRVITLLTPERYLRQQIDEAALSRIAAPALVLWTRANPVHGLDSAEAAVAALPHAHLAIIEDAAHWPQFEQPEAFNSAVLGFLEHHM